MNNYKESFFIDFFHSFIGALLINFLLTVYNTNINVSYFFDKSIRVYFCKLLQNFYIHKVFHNFLDKKPNILFWQIFALYVACSQKFDGRYKNISSSFSSAL